MRGHGVDVFSEPAIDCDVKAYGAHDREHLNCATTLISTNPPKLQITILLPKPSRVANGKFQNKTYSRNRIRPIIPPKPDSLIHRTPKPDKGYQRGQENPGIGYDEDDGTAVCRREAVQGRELAVSPRRRHGIVVRSIEVVCVQLNFVRKFCGAVGMMGEEGCMGIQTKFDYEGL